jgi:cbb3-type cytochrome oxidase maturation protein
MTSLAWLIPVALFLGGLGLAAFLWSLRRGQFDDLDGASWRALDDRALEPASRGSETMRRRTKG